MSWLVVILRFQMFLQTAGKIVISTKIRIKDFLTGYA